MTKQQEIIRKLLERSQTHPTAEELYWEAKKEMPNISMGTVYRNLGQMAEEGSIVRLHFAGQPDHYDKTTRPHDHAICVQCGSISDVELSSLKSMIEDTLKVGILSYELNIQCVCNACQAKVG